MATLKYLISSGTWDWAGYYNGEAPAMYPSRLTPNTTGLVFTAIYDDGTQKIVTPTGDGVGNSTPTHGGVSWRFSYTEGGVTVSTLVYMNTCGPLIFDKFTAQAVKNIGFSDVGIKGAPVGGTIFYINYASTSTYTFYNASGTQVSEPTVGTDCTGWTYTKSGTSANKFYVYESTTGLVTNKYWGYYQITTSATENFIGGGKTNTSTVLAITDTSSYASNSIWKYIREMRTNKVNGCDDWFVGCQSEYEQLRLSGTTGAGWFSSYAVYASQETDYETCWNWFPSTSSWNQNYLKNQRWETSVFIPIRAF